MTFSTYLTGSEPGDKIKNRGMIGSESWIDELKISINEFLVSISINYYPLGSVSLINLERATVIRSGRRHLKTKSFLNGVWSSFFH